MPPAEQNWARNLTYSAKTLHRPTTIAEIQEIVRRASKIRALGTRHCFNPIADCGEEMVSTEKLNRILSLDPKGRTVTIESGVTYGQLGPYLHAHGFALHNLASLPHISVAGAVATATHGSGDRNGNLATIIKGVEFVTANGEIVTASRDSHPATYSGMVIALGALGIVTRLTVAIEPTYHIRQMVYENLPFAALDENFDQITGSAYSVSLFTDWRTNLINQIWMKHKDDGRETSTEFFGARTATRNLHPIAGISAENCTEQMGRASPWHERLPHFKMEFMPSSGEELQAEYFVPREHAVPALKAVAALRDQLAPVLLISEIRTMCGDWLWMSPHYRQNSVGIHFTLKPDREAVRSLLPQIEAAIAPFDARPHWGKCFTMSRGRLQALYRKLPDFRRLLATYDPRGKFRNDFLESRLLGNL